jgi:PAS domain S-box-containing protein
MERSGIVADLEGKIIEYSKGAEEIFGYTKEEVLGKSVEIFHPERTRDMLPRLFEEAMKGESNEEVVLVRKNGKEFPARLRVTPVKDSQGRITGLLGVTEDLSR